MNKTAISLLRAWKEIKTSAIHAFKPGTGHGADKDQALFLRKQMELCLDSPGGEISQRAHTANLGRTYLELDAAGRLLFFKVLAGDFGLHHESLAKLAREYADSEEENRLELEIELRKQIMTPRSIILRQFTALPDGFKFLVDMRAEVMSLLKENPKLKSLEYDLKHILSTWFDIGLLDLVEITWNSPAALLEKLIEYEAVHKITSWDDLKNRLDSDRRVFAFLHNKMPCEPLIFVHVALVHGMSNDIQQLLDEEAPAVDVDEADTAIFYSISNAQKGLAGISFGNFLIKRVVSQLTDEMKQIKTYATLSPVPGFMDWLNPILVQDNKGVLRPGEVELLKSTLLEKWYEDAKLTAALKPVLMRLAAQYLVHAKKNDKLLDPVANFHLFNGARLERLNWLADLSPKGLRQSAGIMVNYHYKLDEIDQNHEAFVEYGKIATGKQVTPYLE